MDFILNSGRRFKVFLTFHSYGEVISFPWCDTADPCMDYYTLLEGGTIMGKAIYKTNGQMYKVGNFKNIMYYASGTSVDWSYGVARIPFSYLVELGNKKHRFSHPIEEIIDCSKGVLNGIKALAQFVDNKCIVFKSSLSRAEKNK